MIIKDSNRFGRLTSEKLEAFQRKYNFSFPNDYKNFLLEHNGGRPSPNTVREPETAVQWIQGIHDGEHWAQLEENLNTLQGRVPSNTIPVANDGLGNQFLLSLRKDSYGEVWFWDHENEAEENAENYFDNIIKSANSFTEFLENLYEWVASHGRKIKF